MKIRKKLVMFNDIPYQTKEQANTLSVQEWNKIINTLVQQTNDNAEVLKNIQDLLLGVFDSADTVHDFSKASELGLLSYLYRYKADLTKTGHVVPSQIANAQIKIIEIDSLDVEDPDEDALYILDGEQYRAYKGALIKLTSLRPLEDMINVDNVIIDGGEYE
jgi:alpha-acetolactate decarboxylase